MTDRQTDGQTDERTDTLPIAKTALCGRRADKDAYYGELCFKRYQNTFTIAINSYDMKLY